MSLLVCLEKSLQKSFEKTQRQRNQSGLKRVESTWKNQLQNQLEKRINFKINLKKDQLENQLEVREKRTKIQSGLYLLIYEINADFLDSMLSTLFSVFHFYSSEKIAQKTTKRKNTQAELFSWLLSIFGQLPKSGARSLVKIICTRPKVKSILQAFVFAIVWDSRLVIIINNLLDYYWGPFY